MNSNSDSEVTQGDEDFRASEVNDLRVRLDQFLEYDSKRDEQLKLIFESYSTRIADYETENRNLRKELNSLKGLAPSSRNRTSLSSNEMDHLACLFQVGLEQDCFSRGFG
jgi:hypothetical protein